MALPVAHAAPGTTERISVTTNATQRNHISGRRGAPVSSAGQHRHRRHPANARSPSNGIRGGISYGGQAISADGCLVVFHAQAASLVPGDTNTCLQVPTCTAPLAPARTCSSATG